MREQIAQAAIVVAGRIFADANHGFAYNAARNAGLDPDTLPFEDGFTTTRGRFVGREEAYEIAEAAGQFDVERDEPLFPLVSEELALAVTV